MTFDKKGFLTTEERKEQLVHMTGMFTWESSNDLSKGVDVYCTTGDVPLKTYTHELNTFMCWWLTWVRPHLNGFSGLDTVEFKFHGFTIDNQYHAGN